MDDESKAIDADDVSTTKAPVNKNSSKALKPRAVAQKPASLPKDPEVSNALRDVYGELQAHLLFAISDLK